MSASVTITVNEYNPTSKFNKYLYIDFNWDGLNLIFRTEDKSFDDTLNVKIYI
jgi:hypothetical protein